MEEKYLWIKEECLKADETDPIALAIRLMGAEKVNMHGPEHHVLDGACFLTAMHNAGVEFNLAAAIDELTEQGRLMPGATCGKWGVCGSCASVGAALAILHGTGPLSHNQYYKDNMNLVSQALAKLAEVGGPRCCKRNAFLSLQTAVKFVKEQYGIELSGSENKVVCGFFHKNQQCLGAECPFFAR